MRAPRRILYVIFAAASILGLPFLLLYGISLLGRFNPFDSFWGELGAADIVSAGIFYLAARKCPLPSNIFVRWLPLLWPVLIILYILLPYQLWMISPLIGVFTGLVLAMALGTCILLCVAFAVGARTKPARPKKSGRLALCGILMVGIFMNAGFALYGQSRIFRAVPDEATVGHGIFTSEYMPGYPWNRLVSPDVPPSLRLEPPFPRLDGAIALAPFYGAVGKALYDASALDEKDVREALDEAVICRNTPDAVAALVRGDVDVFFGVSLSEGQQRFVQEAGLTAVERRFGREAFVFFTHKDNPVRNLSLNDIRAVYSGKIKNWKALGGRDVPILAFQRPEGSGSQTAMQKIMRGASMRQPLLEERMRGMGDIVLATAAYRNRDTALGYSFRVYVTTLFANPDIALVSIDGVAPTAENIASGRYPLVYDLVAVTVRPPSGPTMQMLDWIAGPEGQALLRKVGYVPLTIESDE